MRGHLSHRYLIALGSNRGHVRHGGPRRIIRAALAAIGALDARVLAVSPTMSSRPLGPSQRDYANAAAVIETALRPRELLRELQRIELDFGRRRRGRRWSARTLDLDIVLWDGGVFSDDALAIPHPHFRERDFVLGPAAAIAGRWRDPVTGLSLAHLHARLTKP